MLFLSLSLFSKKSPRITEAPDRAKSINTGCFLDKQLAENKQNSTVGWNLLLLLLLLLLVLFA